MVRRAARPARPAGPPKLDGDYLRLPEDVIGGRPVPEEQVRPLASMLQTHAMRHLGGIPADFEWHGRRSLDGSARGTERRQLSFSRQGQLVVIDEVKSGATATWNATTLMESTSLSPIRGH